MNRRLIEPLLWPLRYQLSHWDALIIAAALLGGCDTLYSEDLQHGQLFEDGLRVVNPFIT